MSKPMTKERLDSLHTLRREITRTKKRLAILRNEKHQSHAAKRAALILENRLNDYLLAAQNEAAELVDYISNIEDATVREIFMLRYFDEERSWQRIAFLAGEHDESYVRRRHNAYLKKSDKVN